MLVRSFGGRTAALLFACLALPASAGAGDPRPPLREAQPRDLGRERPVPRGAEPPEIHAPPAGQYWDDLAARALSACALSTHGVAWVPGVPGAGGGSGGPFPPFVVSSYSNEAFVASRAQISGGAGWDQLVTYDSRGTLIQWLTDDAWDHASPVWSPVFSSGEQSIAFRADENDDNCYDLWRMDADGGGARRLHASIEDDPVHGCARWVDWSPDGKWLLRTVLPAPDEGARLIVHDAYTGEVVADVTPDPSGAEHSFTTSGAPSWSADRDCDFMNGLQTGIAYTGIVVSDVPGSPSRELFVMDLLVDASRNFHPGATRRLTSTEPRWRNESPDWSPDGESIAFLQERYDPVTRGSTPFIMVIASAGGTPEELLGPDRGDSPRWSPDGRRLSYMDYVRPPGGGDPASTDVEIFRMDLDGATLPSQVTDDNNDRISSPDWNPGWIDDLE